MSHTRYLLVAIVGLSSLAATGANGGSCGVGELIYGTRSAKLDQSLETMRGSWEVESHRVAEGDCRGEPEAPSDRVERGWAYLRISQAGGRGETAEAAAGQGKAAGPKLMMVEVCPTADCRAVEHSWTLIRPPGGGGWTASLARAELVAEDAPWGSDGPHGGDCRMEYETVRLERVAPEAEGAGSSEAPGMRLRVVRRVEGASVAQEGELECTSAEASESRELMECLSRQVLEARSVSGGATNDIAPAPGAH